MSYVIVTHECPSCQFENPTRSCQWEETVGDEQFATVEEADAAIATMQSDSDYAGVEFNVREIGEQYPVY